MGSLLVVGSQTSMLSPRTETFTCSGCSCGLRSSRLGRRASATPAPWRPRRGSRRCAFNWQSYNYDKYNLPQENLPPGKLLLYPIQVSHYGEVSNLDMFKSFPDYPDSAKV